MFQKVSGPPEVVANGVEKRHRHASGGHTLSSAGRLRGQPEAGVPASHRRKYRLFGR